MFGKHRSAKGTYKWKRDYKNKPQNKDPWRKTQKSYTIHHIAHEQSTTIDHPWARAWDKEFPLEEGGGKLDCRIMVYVHHEA